MKPDKKKLSAFWVWASAHVDPRLLFTPFGTVNRRVIRPNGAEIGYTDYYLFGLRMARIQKTYPYSIQ